MSKAAIVGMKTVTKTSPDVAVNVLSSNEGGQEKNSGGTRSSVVTRFSASLKSITFPSFLHISTSAKDGNAGIKVFGASRLKKPAYKLTSSEKDFCNVPDVRNFTNRIYYVLKFS